ncbi:MAG: hypothetical protein ACKV1O_29915 [Saprospiraceae bacterium]
MLKEKILNEIDELIKQTMGMITTVPERRLSGDALALLISSLALVKDVVGKESPYFMGIDSLDRGWPTDQMGSLCRLLEQFRNYVDRGWAGGLHSLISAEIFGNFLEMAEYLLSEGYKDPSAVIIGSTLESHLRDLCNNNEIPITKVDNSGKSQPIKANQMNIELTKSGVYSSLENKSVLAWLDLRNKAAHGQYSEYGKDQVITMLTGVRDFIIRNPA